LNDFVFGLMENSVKEFDAPSAFGSTTTFRYATGSFSGGSDHAEFTDSTIGIPCVMLLQWPDLFYHTSLDTIDKVSEDSLKRVGWIAAVAMLTLANAGAEEALILAAQVASRAMSRIQDAGREAIQEIGKTKERAKNTKIKELASEIVRTGRRHTNKLEHLVWREQEAVKSVKRLGDNPELDALLNAYCEDIRKMGAREIARIHEVQGYFAKALRLRLSVKTKEPESGELKKIVPRRLFKGTLSFDVVRKGLGEKEFEWYLEIEEKDREFDKKVPEILNFMDGKRSLYEILKAVSAEYSDTNPEHALKILRDLEKLKLVALR
jgi:hypothetical protein